MCSQRVELADRLPVERRGDRRDHRVGRDELDAGECPHLELDPPLDIVHVAEHEEAERELGRVELAGVARMANAVDEVVIGETLELEVREEAEGETPAEVWRVSASTRQQADARARLV